MKKIAFIGVGNMATAIIHGMTSSGLFSMSDIILYNRTLEKVEPYRKNGADIAHNLTDAVTGADYIFLCVKPQNFPEILNCLSEIPGVESKLFITIAAGISSETVSNATNGAAVIRAMPNTPMLISKGVVAVCRDSKVTDDQFCDIHNIFSSCGSVLLIEECNMNKIISVTGSSPAYVFLLIKAMYEGAIAQGLLSENTADGLHEKELIDSICDTIIGAAELMKSGTKTPDEQIQTVASKGGTTERAIAELNRFDFCEGVISAMQKCTERAEELSLGRS